MKDNVVLYEGQVTEAARAAGIADSTWRDFMRLLQPLKRHHIGMYAHTLRVGLYCYGLATFEQQPDTKLPLLGGCGHDIGKQNVPCAILDQTDTLTEAEWTVLMMHPRDGYTILRPQFPATAMVAGLHHSMQPNGYGVDLTEAPEWLSSNLTSAVVDATKLVVVADVFDAMTTRVNARTVVDPNDTTGCGEVLAGWYPEWKTRIVWLVDHRL